MTNTESDASGARAAAYRTLVTVAELMALASRGEDLVLLDCGFDLADPAAGERDYRESHLPGAIYAHLDRDLCGTRTGRNGRHPLPAREAFAARAGAWGVGPGTQVVAYDAQGGPYAARAWWMLRWLGHGAAAVLDGGPAAWLAAGGRVHPQGPQPPQPRARPPYPLGATMPVVDAAALLASLGDGSLLVVDARAGERYRGEVEPLDAVAGHIPGARHRFFKDNLAAGGRFKPAAALRVEFAQLGLDAVPGPAVVHQCGSGVTACHNLLAMAHAGLANSALYPGSWSEWCADPARPVARG